MGRQQISQEARFWNRLAKRYANQPIADETAYRRKLEITQSYLRPDMELLEIGCGTGGTAIAHAPFVTHIDAVDVSGEMLKRAEARARAAGIDTITFRRSAFDELPVPDESRDAVLTLSLLHLLPNRDAAIARIWRMLKPGGYFISSTICLGEQSALLRLVLPVMRLIGLAPRVICFGPDELRRSVTAAGFEIVEDWQPRPKSALFIVARKPANLTA
jgi:ubiquinone/menaquinone biosynthesis C-methylase UbiE